MERVRLIGRHQHHLSRRHPERRARNTDVSVPFQNMGHRIERCGVLAQRLPFVEREQRDGSSRSLEQRAADHRAILVGAERHGRKKRGGGHFR